jgi:hypothetical protein
LIQLRPWEDQSRKCQLKWSFKQRNQNWSHSPLMRTPTCQFKNLTNAEVADTVTPMSSAYWC